MESEFRHLPSVDRIVSDERLKQLQKDYPPALLVELTRHHLEKARSSIAAGHSAPSLDDIVADIHTQVETLGHPILRPVINATGVVLHTNIGRAPLSPEAIAAMDEISRGYCNLEFDLESGTRGSRHVHIESLLCQLSGAESAMVVNNNASAVLLALSALARRKEVIMSRGQTVEIGGGFRIPDVMRQSGAKLVEVGTTNRTYIADYEQAITSSTAALMRVHSSNFKIVGFTESATLPELVALGRKHNLPVIDDLGSGCFLDTARFGLDPEPMVQESVAAGVSLICFSGDKLLGGPQSGIIIGEKKLVDKLKKHPLARAVRIDKIRLAGLAVTLIHYLKGEAESKIPVWRMISSPLSEIERRAGLWSQALPDLARVIDGESMIGGGSLPGSTMPTKLVAVGGDAGKKSSSFIRLLGQKLRAHQPPVVGRIESDVLLLDPRSVLPEDDNVVTKALLDVAPGLK